MSKIIIVSLVIGILVVGGVMLFLSQERMKSTNGIETPVPSEQEQPPKPTDEEAELVAFGFIQDFIASAPPNSDTAALRRAYEALSVRAKAAVSEDAISRDLAGFVGVQDVPDQGASVEDLQLSGDTATLIVGLNFSGGRVLRAINLLVENGEWKVDNVYPLEQYPPQ